jgi:hypothetical protein
MKNTTQEEMKMFSEIMAVKATEKGALDGFQASCSCCGLTIKSSMRTMIESDIAAHEKWHAKRDK